MSTPDTTTFAELGLSPAILQALETVGYERPSPIQARTIPLVLQGRDVLGQAQTGTGKTAAFALPLLSKIDLTQSKPQVLVLAPTRELAIQVAEAFQTYAQALKGFHVLPIYGGSDFRGQLSGLRRGAHVVVGTPGRIMDHMRRNTLDLSGLKAIVLDEADEMLRMGFIDDVQWILEQAPVERQVALFSATMPPPIRKIANQHLRNPEHVTIEQKTASAETIRQRYWPVRGINKLDALTRILEAEPFTGMIIFVRTKTLTVELADRLNARGFAASPLNGDMSQQLRENTVDKLRKGTLDILVATDVAARGLDVERISHVLNYDIPYDVESYIHRIGRTGRAGKHGDAILFVAPREQRLLGAIERATRKKIELMELPSTELINDRRVGKFMQQITDTLADKDLGPFQELIDRYEVEHNVPAREIAAALAQLLQGEQPLFLENKPAPKEYESRGERPERPRREDSRSEGRRDNRDSSRDAGRDSARDAGRDAGREEPRSRPPRAEGERPPFPREERAEKPRRPREDSDAAPEYKRRPEPDAAPEFDRKPRRANDDVVEDGMDRYRVEVGHAQEIKPSNIVGAIANEAGIDSQYIGRIQIFDEYSFVDLPQGMPKEVFMHLKRVWVGKKQLNIVLEGSGKPKDGSKPASKVRKPGGDFKKSGSKKPFDKKPHGKKPPRD
jgi:ATP-dependent RNA helicase DeaD